MNNISYEMMWTEKYRPKTIDEIYGHEEIKSRLKGFIKSNSMLHLMFAGPPGTGKTSAATTIAREILGEDNLLGNMLELNASDDRGIDVIREKVKKFARILPPDDIPFKIITLDEADALTSAAQHALRRTMEQFVTTSRFILICNYPGKIIEPIQSRCAYFKFTKLPKKSLEEYLMLIAKKEKVEFEAEGIQTIVEICEGDMRKAINILQASAINKETISRERVMNTVGRIDNKEVLTLIELAVEGMFEAAKNLLQKLIYEMGISGGDIIRGIYNNIQSLNLEPKLELKLLKHLAEIDFRLIEGATPDIQIGALLAEIGNYSK